MQRAPRYPRFKSLTLEDREQIRSFFRRYPPVTSELTFTNLFIWRRHYKFRWCVGAESLLILGETSEGSPFALPPIGGDDLAPAFRQLFDYLGDFTPSPQIHRAPEQLARRYGASLSFTVEEDRANSDYVYRTESLVYLRGRKYHRKRNQIKQFRRQYDYGYQPLDSTYIDACLELEDDWCRLRQCAADPSLLGEERAIREALLHYDELDCRGGVILVDGKVVAFSLGEPLNHDTTVIHIEKADPAFPGSYAVINQEFCRNVWTNFTYINREQDLGEEGLRKAKLSYYPDHLVNKVILQATV